MKIPSEIDVFGKLCKVSIIKELRDEEGNRIDGLFCAKSFSICIDKDCDNKDHTLVHELGHAMFYRVSLGQTEIDPQIEEIIVNNNATLITELFNLKFKVR